MINVKTKCVLEMSNEVGSVLKKFIGIFKNDNEFPRENLTEYDRGIIYKIWDALPDKE